MTRQIKDFSLKAQRRLKEICIVNQQPQKLHEQDILQKHLCILPDACHELLCIFRDFIALGKQDAEVTKSLEMMTVVQVQHEGIL